MQIIQKVNHSISDYISLKTIVSLLTGNSQLHCFAVDRSRFSGFLGHPDFLIQLYSDDRVFNCYDFSGPDCSASIW